MPMTWWLPRGAVSSVGEEQRVGSRVDVRRVGHEGRPAGDEAKGTRIRPASCSTMLKPALHVAPAFLLALDEMRDAGRHYFDEGQQILLGNLLVL